MSVFGESDDDLPVGLGSNARHSLGGWAVPGSAIGIARASVDSDARSPAHGGSLSPVARSSARLVEAAAVDGAPRLLEPGVNRTESGEVNLAGRLSLTQYYRITTSEASRKEPGDCVAFAGVAAKFRYLPSVGTWYVMHAQHRQRSMQFHKPQIAVEDSVTPS